MNINQKLDTYNEILESCMKSEMYISQQLPSVRVENKTRV